MKHNFIILHLKQGAHRPYRDDYFVDLSCYHDAVTVSVEPNGGGVAAAFRAGNALTSNRRGTTRRGTTDGDLLFNATTGAWHRVDPRGFLRTFPLGDMPTT